MRGTWDIWIISLEIFQNKNWKDGMERRLQNNQVLLYSIRKGKKKIAELNFPH